MEPQKHFRFLQKKIAASIKSDDCQRTAGEQVVHPPVADVPDLRTAGLFDTIPGG
jgi:hypothetical protein